MSCCSRELARPQSHDRAARPAAGHRSHAAAVDLWEVRSPHNTLGLGESEKCHWVRNGIAAALIEIHQLCISLQLGLELLALLSDLFDKDQFTIVQHMVTVIIWPFITQQDPAKVLNAFDPQGEH